MAQLVLFLRSDLARALGVSIQRGHQLAEGLTPAATTPTGRPLFDVATVEALRRREGSRRRDEGTRQ